MAELSDEEKAQLTVDLADEIPRESPLKLWNQGKKAEGALLDSDNGRVYPMYKDTVYVRWTEDEDEDGSYSMVFFKGRMQARIRAIEV